MMISLTEKEKAHRCNVESACLFTARAEILHIFVKVFKSFGKTFCHFQSLENFGQTLSLSRP